MVNKPSKYSSKTNCVCNLFMTNGGSNERNEFATISLVNGAAKTIITIKSKPPGNFFSRYFTTNDIRYPAINPGKIPRPEQDSPINTAYIGETPRARGTSIAAATPPKLPLDKPTSFKNPIFNTSPKNAE